MTNGVRPLLLLVLLTASCRHGPEVREGPPVEATFAPPRSGALVERWQQTRSVAIDFQGGETRDVQEKVSGRVLESYEPASHGRWRVTATVQEESARQDGVPVPQVLPLIGVPFSHLVEADGTFIEPVDVDETLRTMHERVRDPRLGKVLETAVTPEVVGGRIERSWRNRYGQHCNRPLDPGAISFSLEEQELPAGGPARMIARHTVIGTTQRDGQRVLEIAIEYGGASSAMVAEPGADALLASAGGARSLMQNVEGEGARFISLSGCHVLEESATISGSAALNEDVAEAAGMAGLPERIRFRVVRHIERTPAQRARR